MIVTVQWIAENYNKFNREYWGGQLPNDIKFKVGMARMMCGFASFRYNVKDSKLYNFKITISNYNDSPEWVNLNTLLHEMIHIADFYFHPEHYIDNHIIVRRYNAHGEFFLKEAARLKEFGWNITKYVTSEEEAVSRISDKVNEKNKRLMKKGIKFLLADAITPIRSNKGELFRYSFVRVGGKYGDYINNFIKYQDEYRWVAEYVSHDESALNARICRKLSSYLTDDIESIINKYKLEFVRMIVNNGENDLMGKREEDIIKENVSRVINEFMMKNVCKTIYNMDDDPMVNIQEFDENSGEISIM